LIEKRFIVLALISGWRTSTIKAGQIDWLWRLQFLIWCIKDALAGSTNTGAAL